MVPPSIEKKDNRVLMLQGVVVEVFGAKLRTPAPSQRKRSSVQGSAGIVVPPLSAEPKPRTSLISCSTTDVKSPWELANVTFRPMQPEPINVGQGLPLNDCSGVFNPRALPLGDFTRILALPVTGLVEPLGVLASAVASSALVALAPSAVRYVV